MPRKGAKGNTEKDAACKGRHLGMYKGDGGEERGRQGKACVQQAGSKGKANVATRPRPWPPARCAGKANEWRLPLSFLLLLPSSQKMKKEKVQREERRD